MNQETWDAACARIAELESLHAADRSYMDAAEKRIAGLEAQRDDWRMSFRGEEMRAEQAEAEVEKLRLITVKGVPAGVDVDLYYDQWKQADDALAEQNFRAKQLFEQRNGLRELLLNIGATHPQLVPNLDDWLTELKARAEEGSE